MSPRKGPADTRADMRNIKSRALKQHLWFEDVIVRIDARL